MCPTLVSTLVSLKLISQMFTYQFILHLNSLILFQYLPTHNEHLYSYKHWLFKTFKCHFRTEPLMQGHIPSMMSWQWQVFNNNQQYGSLFTHNYLHTYVIELFQHYTSYSCLVTTLNMIWNAFITSDNREHYTKHIPSYFSIKCVRLHRH